MRETHTHLDLTPAEIEFLACSIPAHALWPSEDMLSLLRQVPNGEVAGGPHFRTALLDRLLHSGREQGAAGDQGDENDPPGETVAFEMNVSELWLLDSVLLQHDLRREKLSDGAPLMELAGKIWALLLELYEEELPQLRKERNHAEHDTAEDAYPNPDAAVASAEAILRSQQGEGAG